MEKDNNINEISEKAQIIYQFSILARSILIKHERLEDAYIRERMKTKQDSSILESLNSALFLNIKSARDLVQTMEVLKIKNEEDPNMHFEPLFSFVKHFDDNNTLLYYSISSFESIQKQSPNYSLLIEALELPVNANDIKFFSFSTTDSFFDYEIVLNSGEKIKERIKLFDLYISLNSYISSKIPSSNIIVSYFGFINEKPYYLASLVSENYNQPIAICNSDNTLDIYFYFLNIINKEDKQND